MISFWTLAAAILGLFCWPGYLLILHRVASGLVVRYNLALVFLGFCFGSRCTNVVPNGMLGSCTSLLVLAGFTLRLGLVTARDLDLVDLSAVPEADNILSIHTAQANSLPIFFGATQGAPSTVSEADVSFSVHSACVCFCRAVFEC